MTEQGVYGLWASPITPRSLAESLRLSEPCWDTDGRTLGWVEGRSDRGVLVVSEDGGAPRDLTSDISVRAFVGYGGGDFTLSRRVAYFVAQHDQRIYRQSLSGGPARPITPPFGAASTPTVSPDGRWLAYVHTVDDIDCIAIVDTEGKHWPRRLAEGRDFYMQPAWHPDSRRLAWVEWDHPQMPWDGCELVFGTLNVSGDLPDLAEWTVVAGNHDVSVFQPAFHPDGSALFYVSDESGWTNIYARDVTNGQSTPVTAETAEFGTPAWNQGMRRLAVGPSGEVVAIRNSGGFDRLVTVHPGATPRDLGARHEGYTNLAHPALTPDGNRVALVADGGAQSPRVIVMDLSHDDEAPAVIRRSATESTPVTALSWPEPVSWTSFDGEEAHGVYYPPASDRFESAGKPPLVVLVHGGPTSQTKAAWHPQTQFLATRGYGVLWVNYRGSTGYGRDYMLKLRESWGIYDLQACKTGAEALAAQGRVDSDRLVIMGGSAGGYTVLQSLVELPGTYRAGVCLYGVANMFTLASDTHKFEARYLDTMLGPLPEASAVYRERSPIFHADRIVDPIAVFQGDIDRVVPREQSDSIVASLRARGVPHAYHVYEGEGHGWRKTETIERFYNSLDAFLRQYVVFG